MNPEFVRFLQSFQYKVTIKKCILPEFEVSISDINTRLVTIENVRNFIILEKNGKNKLNSAEAQLFYK